MDYANTHLDWGLVQSFLAVAEEGSLSAAATRLSLSQPTLGRHIRLIEQQLRSELFHRVPRGYILTEAGQMLLQNARTMRDAARDIQLTASGLQQDIAGSVRITASEIVSHHLLPTILAGIRRDHPEIQIELVASNSTENLLFREADIAVRMYRPRQLDVVTQFVGTLGLGIYAARDFVARYGRPGNPDELMQYPLVGYDRQDLIIEGMRAAGFDVTRESFGTRCDNQPVYWELVRAGCGIGFGQSAIGEADPQVERILPELEIPGLPVWLTSHEAMRSTPRIRRVWDRLLEGLTPLVLIP